MPDTQLVREATELTRELSSPLLLNHCLRAYHFGCILGARDGLRFDREVFYLACIMHDLGLTPTYADQPGSFEYVGAEAAHAFCQGHAMDESKAALVHDAIALHSAVGIAHKREPEVALMHFGAGADVIGLRLDEIPEDLFARVVDMCPRLDFKEAFAALMAGQAESKPRSHIAGHVGLGFTSRIGAAPFAS